MTGTSPDSFTIYAPTDEKVFTKEYNLILSLMYSAIRVLGKFTLISPHSYFPSNPFYT